MTLQQAISQALLETSLTAYPREIHLRCKTIKFAQCDFVISPKSNVIMKRFHNKDTENECIKHHGTLVYAPTLTALLDDTWVSSIRLVQTNKEEK